MGVVISGEIQNAELVRELAPFMKELQGESAYTGIFVLVIYALRMQVRVYMWCGLHRIDVVFEYIPRASDAIKDVAQFEAIGCICRLDEHTGPHSLHTPDNAQDINHWVACIASPDGHGDFAPDISDDSTDDTVTFVETHLSVSRCLLQTTADGNCGLDAMCLMLGLKRECLARQCLRLELALLC